MATVEILGGRDALAIHNSSRRIAERLMDRAAYAEETGSVQQVETHISWIFLTDHFAYKLKKPVRFDFLDSSTVELRREACENEVRLNRRLAPHAYLGVVPLVMTGQGEVAVDRPGVPIDWVVKMRRLPAENALDALVRRGIVPGTVIEQLARTLADFYNRLPPVTMTVESYRRSIERHVIANRDELATCRHDLDQSQLQRVHSAQLRVLRLVPDVLDERVRNGRIVEGHGDLRPEHIYFDPSPIIIDCIELNQEFRTLDVVDELAFLSMECDLLGATDLAKPILARYFDESGDAPPRQLLDFYRLYRACVRAKVASLRAEQLTGNLRVRQLALASNYLDLAERYSQSMGPPLLVLVRGLPGTGKSTIAQTISQQLGFELLQTDAIRQDVFGPSTHRPRFNEGRYRPHDRLHVYETMHEQAAQLLQSGTSVVLDGTYLAASLRREASMLAKRAHADCVSVHCHCPDKVALQRIGARMRRGHSLSETRPEFFERQRLAEEPDSPDERSLAIDTSDEAAEPIPRVFETLRNRCFSQSLVGG